MTAAVMPVDTSDRLNFALFLSMALHVALIVGVTFSVNRDSELPPTLEITLAVHKSHKAPEKADYLAQFNQQASGTMDKAKELATERPAKIADTQINDISPQPQISAATPAEKQSEQVSSEEHSRYKTQIQINPQDSEKARKRDGDEKEIPILSAEIASLRAKLDQQRQQYAKKPRIRRLTSVATKSTYDAEYLHKWSTKVEFVGNNNYPKGALRDKVFGDLRLAAVILPNGTIEKVEILKSSGHAILDDAAMQIVHLASPFAPFPPEIRKEVDQLEIIRTWRFEITGLRTAN